MDADRQVEKAKRDEERRRLAMALLRAQMEQQARVGLDPMGIVRDPRTVPATIGVRG